MSYLSGLADFEFAKVLSNAIKIAQDWSNSQFSKAYDMIRAGYRAQFPGLSSDQINKLTGNAFLTQSNLKTVLLQLYPAVGASGAETMAANYFKLKSTAALPSPLPSSAPALAPITTGNGITDTIQNVVKPAAVALAKSKTKGEQPYMPLISEPLPGATQQQQYAVVAQVEKTPAWLIPLAGAALIMLAMRK